jgi:hypothetical protein
MCAKIQTLPHCSSAKRGPGGALSFAITPQELNLSAPNESQLGPEAATTATAHKIAVIFYTMVKNQVEYDESIWVTRDAHREKRLEMKLKRQAKLLGYKLVPMEQNAA